MNYKVEAWSWCADYCKKNQWNPHDSYFWNKANLEYRRQHNIFEVGDKVIFDDHFMHGEIMTVSKIDGCEMWMDDGAKWTHNFNEMIKHATDEEIKAGKRLEVN